MLNVSVDEKTTTNLIKKIKRMAGTTTGGEKIIAITELLSMLYFPAPTARKINQARGDVRLSFTNERYGKFRNRGTVVSEKLPGAEKYLKIKLELQVSGDIEIYDAKKIVLKNLIGIVVVWPFGIENSLDEVVITPKVVNIDL